jgi:hypothetical protein
MGGVGRWYALNGMALCYSCTGLGVPDEPLVDFGRNFL